MKEKLFTVQPMNQRFSLESGHTYSSSITIISPANSTEDFPYLVTVEPYGLVSNDDTFSASSIYSNIVDWITIENPSGSLKPGEHRIINFTINVPENAPASGQYAILIVMEDKDKVTSDGVNINTTLALASIIYADVAGITVRDGEILDNYIPSFSFEPDITLSATIENRGNLHSDAIIIIDVTNNLTGETVFPIGEQANKFKEIVLPETTRYIARTVDSLPFIGFYKVTQTVYFNDTVSKVEQDLIICPLWFIFVSILLVISIITGIITGIKHHRRKKRLI